MPRENVEELAAFLRERTGEYLRGVVFYDVDGYEVMYVRPDLRRDSLDADIRQMVARLRDESRDREQEAFPFGELDGTVRSFEDAVVMHFPLSDGDGALVAIEPEAASQLKEFMRGCIERL